VTENAPLIKHIEEFRKRIICSAAAIILASSISYLYKEKILTFFIRYIEKAVFLAPHEAFVSYLKLSLFSGVLLASPFIIYQIWAFAWFSLKPPEKKYTAIYGIFSFFLFTAGCSFGYFLGLPIAIDFFMGFANNQLLPMISIGRYINFCGILILLFGILFELPLVVFFVTDLELITPQQLSSKRRHIIVIIFILAAILSPPDIFTQLLIAIPLYLLFEFSVILAKIAKKRKTPKRNRHRKNH